MDSVICVRFWQREISFIEANSAHKEVISPQRDGFCQTIFAGLGLESFDSVIGIYYVLNCFDHSLLNYKKVEGI